MRPVLLLIAATLLAGCGEDDARSDDHSGEPSPTARVTRLEQLEAPCEAEVQALQSAVEVYHALEDAYPGSVAELVAAGVVRDSDPVFVRSIDRRTGALQLVEGAPCSAD